MTSGSRTQRLSLEEVLIKMYDKDTDEVEFRWISVMKDTNWIMSLVLLVMNHTEKTSHDVEYTTNLKL